MRNLRRPHRAMDSTMEHTRSRAEQNIRKLWPEGRLLWQRTIEPLIAPGKTVAEACRGIGITKPIDSRARQQHRGIHDEEARRLTQLAKACARR